MGSKMLLNKYSVQEIQEYFNPQNGELTQSWRNEKHRETELDTFVHLNHPCSAVEGNNLLQAAPLVVGTEAKQC